MLQLAGVGCILQPRNWRDRDREIENPRVGWPTSVGQPGLYKRLYFKTGKGRKEMRQKRAKNVAKSVHYFYDKHKLIGKIPILHKLGRDVHPIILHSGV